MKVKVVLILFIQDLKCETICLVEHGCNPLVTSITITIKFKSTITQVISVNTILHIILLIYES